MSWRIEAGGCVEVMAGMPAASIDAVVCDPPYGLDFMGKAWDRFSALEFEQWTESWAREALRVLKPGGHLLAFGGTRTYHRLAAGIEDAGFEVRDTLAWMYGSGFPKSLDVSRAIDKAAGAERERVPYIGGIASGSDNYGGGGVVHVGTKNGDDPITSEAGAWRGLGTALKPAFEPVVVARKPLSGTVAANVLEHGTGAINVDGCRIGTEQIVSTKGLGQNSRLNDDGWKGIGGRPDPTVSVGRWPSNVLLDEQAAEILDEQSGTLSSGANPSRRGSDKFRGAYGDFKGQEECTPSRGACSGGASRFFYVAKASSAERNAGLDGFAEGIRGDIAQGHQNMLTGSGNERDPLRRNVHPTVKPVEVMRWLVRLVTPPGGTVLDPFTGSGTTGIAAHLEGFDFVGVEREAEYRAIAEARIRWWAANTDAGAPTEAVLKVERDEAQLDIFGDAA